MLSVNRTFFKFSAIFMILCGAGLGIYSCTAAEVERSGATDDYIDGRRVLAIEVNTVDGRKVQCIMMGESISCDWANSKTK